MAGGRITYNGIQINFPRAWNRFEVGNSVKNSQIQSATGIEETLHFFDQDFITAVKQLETGQIEDEVRRFYEYARDGSTFAIEKDRDVGTYISFEGAGNSATVPTITPRGLETNDKTAGTFTRTAVAGSAYFVDPSTGLLTLAPNTNHIPRFVKGKYGHGILIEGARTNLISNVSDLGTNWTNVNSNTLSTNTTETKDPTGNNIADKVTWASSGAFRIDLVGDVIGTQDGVFSVLAKSPSGDVDLTLDLKDDTGVSLASTAFTVKPFDSTNNWGNGFQRFSVSFNNGGSNANDWRVEILGTAAEVCYFCGFQLEEGALFASNPIGFASSSSVTRNGDTAKWSSTNFINKFKGSIFGWVKTGWALGELSADAVLYHCGDDASNNPHSQIQFRSGANEIRVTMRQNNNGTVANALDGTLTGLLTQGTWHNWGFSYDATISNGMKIYWDGALLATSSNTAFNISEIGNFFSLGGLVDSSTNSIFSDMDDVFVSKDVKDATWFNHVFNKGRGYGVRRNRWSSVRLANPNHNPIQAFGDRVNLSLRMKEVLT